MTRMHPRRVSGAPQIRAKENSSMLSRSLHLLSSRSRSRDVGKVAVLIAQLPQTPNSRLIFLPDTVCRRRSRREAV